MRIDNEVIWVGISFLLTLLVFAYLLGDNPFFRFASALLIGVSAGYFTVVIIYQVLITRLVVPLMAGSSLALVPLLLSGMLLMKLSPRFSPVGSPVMALLVGVGAAVAVGGTVLGTLFGQVKGALSFFDPIAGASASSPLRIVEGLIYLVGTLATLAYFHFGARERRKGEGRSRLSTITAAVGKVFIAITLGAVFAGVLTAAITALIERSDFVISTIMSLVR